MIGVWEVGVRVLQPTCFIRASAQNERTSTLGVLFCFCAAPSLRARFVTRFATTAPLNGRIFDPRPYGGRCINVYETALRVATPHL